MHANIVAKGNKVYKYAQVYIEGSGVRSEIEIHEGTRRDGRGDRELVWTATSYIPPVVARV